MKVLPKFIRIITVAPVIAAITVSILYFYNNSFFGGLINYLTALITLTVLPLLAYPVSLLKDKSTRRKFQRTLAIIFSVIGYIAGFTISLITKAPSCEVIIYMTYLLSGLAIAFCSFVLKKKSSGHACGIVGPITILIYYVSGFFAFGYLLLIPVFWASLKMKRHSFSQLVSGGLIPVICLAVSLMLINII